MYDIHYNIPIRLGTTVPTAPHSIIIPFSRAYCYKEGTKSSKLEKTRVTAPRRQKGGEKRGKE